ncbi:hypothetical protein KDA_06570 [Dictyobacter alpinus]|uniref:Uncharacterized protein n=1 Tax=Dictyobacter alpinus TaxID=2014873 RepID=A0A402B1G0_9CHLR|nr:hypothetical protein [Dictyobacter alpinus]GCE25173.1 hypothetical protein KDA_06570 [Dictyobacter alpinus]
METALTVPLLKFQIDMANRLYQQLRQWKDIDQALEALHIRFPEFDVDATLFKVVAVNVLQLCLKKEVYLELAMALWNQGAHDAHLV